MGTCCNKCYSICQPLISCFESLIVYLPVDYTDDTVTIKTSNGQTFVTTQTFDVIAGNHVEIDLATSEFPEGFFSAYGGPYQIRFFDPLGSQIEFVAIDGKPYNCISFQVANGVTDETTAFVNAFYASIPEGY